jgi:hypothetical protein
MIENKGHKEARSYEILYSQQSSKKRKIFRDGILCIEGNIGTVIDSDSAFVCKFKCEKLVQQLHIQSFPFDYSTRYCEIQIEREKICGLVETAIESCGSISSSIHKNDADATPIVQKKLKPFIAVTKVGVQHTCSSFELDPSIMRVMKPHQVEGARFILRRLSGIDSKSEGELHSISSRSGLGFGALLCDDMGLGKRLVIFETFYAIIELIFQPDCIMCCVEPNSWGSWKSCNRLSGIINRKLEKRGLRIIVLNK